MLKVRLQRMGKKGQAYFRLVVLEHTTRPKGEYLELLGSYDPHKNTMDVKTDRVKHWMSKGAKLSATANNLLVGKKLIEGEKVQVWKAKPSSRAQAEGKKEVTEAPSPSKDSGSPASAPTTAPEVKEDKPAEETPSPAVEEKPIEETPTAPTA